MKILNTGFEGLLIIEPAVFKDDRGYFFESYNKKKFADHGINIDFVQDNQSSSVRNVIRGLHFQRPPQGQVKLIRSLRGVILDVVVDLRKTQPTFGKVFSIELSSDNGKQLLIPVGFAHGFSVLSERAEILYKCSDFYAPASEGGVLFNDPALAIDWKVEKDGAIVSPKDQVLPRLNELTSFF